MNSQKISLEKFEKEYPQYKNRLFDRMRVEEFPQLKENEVYADFTGAALPPKFLLDFHHNFLTKNLIGNPHSHHRPSSFAMQEIVSTRDAILKYFNADPNQYEVIFTSSATSAILLLQHFLFDGGELLLTADNHNSVNGLREIVKRKGGVTRYSPINDDLTLNSVELIRALEYTRSEGNKLFCFPAKSNYTGMVHDFDWVRIAQGFGWSVLLDAAAYLSNRRLDLSGEIQPDFIPISFYKMFGYPTGLGCLIIKKSAYKKLHKQHFAGGSILLVSVMMDFFAPETLGYARFEDGTVNFAGISAIKAGLEFVESLGDFTPRITSVSSWLYDRLSELKENSCSVILHNKRGYDTVTFSIEKNGKIIDAWNFEEFANTKDVYVRTGCFCNPGVNEKVFGYEIESYAKFYNDAIKPDAITIENLRKYSGDKPIGAVRASFGYTSNFSDVEKFAETVKDFMLQS
jgi:selenocysteine lyase/cysteine desulfurase